MGVKEDKAIKSFTNKIKKGLNKLFNTIKEGKSI